MSCETRPGALHFDTSSLEFGVGGSKAVLNCKVGPFFVQLSAQSLRFVLNQVHVVEQPVQQTPDPKFHITSSKFDPPLRALVEWA